MLKIHAKNRVEEYDLRARYCKDDYHMSGRGKLDTEFSIHKVVDMVGFDRGDRVLDIGPGNGYLFQVLHARVRECIGVDPSNAMVQRLRDKFSDYENVSFRCAPSSKLPLPDQYFDKVIMNGVMPYLEDENEVMRTLAEIRRVAKDTATIFIGGVAFVDESKIMPSETSIWGRLHRKARTESYAELFRSVKMNLGRKLRLAMDQEVIILPSDHGIFLSVEAFLNMCLRYGLIGQVDPTQAIYGEITSRKDYMLHMVEADEQANQAGDLSGLSRKNKSGVF